MAAHETRYDLYHSHYWMSGWVAQRLAVRRPAPIIQMFHTLGAMKDLARGPGDPPEIAPRRLVEHELLHSVDAVVAATAVDRQHMVELYGADPARIQVIPPGVDLELFRPIPQAEALARLGDGPAHRMILFVGRMDPVKGLDTLVHAVARLLAERPEWRYGACLCIVGGDKPDLPTSLDDTARRIDALRQELGLVDFVTFLGPQAQVDLPYYYSAAQVVVVPSRYESFGMVALEAMACGVPVIASDVGGLSTLVRDGRTGFLVPDGDVEALADRIRLLFNDRGYRNELGRQAMAVAEAYSWPAVAERVEALYGAVLRRRVEAWAL
jgi:D-inositol-3-phosphate glycosyltransferase